MFANLKMSGASHSFDRGVIIWHGAYSWSVLVQSHEMNIEILFEQIWALMPIWHHDEKE